MFEFSPVAEGLAHACPDRTQREAPGDCSPGADGSPIRPGAHLPERREYSAPVDSSSTTPPEDDRAETVEAIGAEAPEAMIAAKRWLVWRSVPNRDPGKKPRKVPVYADGTPRSGALDSPADRARLVDFETAARALLAAPPGRFAGLGFALGPDESGQHWQGIDLDGTTSRPELAALVERLPGYAERSPSGTGVHAVGLGAAFPALGSNATGIEAYSAGRFFTVTGDAIGGDLGDLSPFVTATLAPLHKPRQAPGAGMQAPSLPTVAGPEIVSPDTLADLRSALAAILADDYSTWVAMGHALVGLGDPGRDLWMEWSATSAKFDAKEARDKWRGLTGERTGYAAVFAEAQRRGWANPAKGRAPADAADKPPTAEQVDKAVAVCEAAIAGSANDPGILARAEFRDAARLLREHAHDEWFAVRGPLKKAATAVGVKLSDIEHATRPPGDGDSEESSTADELVALVADRCELFHGADGTCYATLGGSGPAKTYRLDTRAFAQWLSCAYYDATSTPERRGRAASDTAIRTAVMVLSGIATNEGPERPVYLRAAAYNGAYYIDLGDEYWRAIEVTAHGWRIIDRPPVRFWRSSTLRAMPPPLPGGDLSLLWHYANIPERERPLVLGVLLGALRPDTPFPILELIGQQGTAKSSTQAKLRRCVDPNAVDLRAAPKSVEDLFVSAGANWVASLNNLSHLSAPVQDALCSLATGGGFAGRTLYTNADETLIEAKRPVFINGIVPLVTAQDLTDRVVHIELPELSAYRTETEMDEDFERDAAGIIGGLLDLFVRTLAALPSVRLDRPPRMADFARLGEAMMRSAGQPAGSFLTLYGANRRESIARSLEASPVAAAVRRLVDEAPPADRLVWSGTMARLHAKLSLFRDGADAWPRSARGLGDALRRQRPALAQVGIAVEIGARGREGFAVTIARAGDPGGPQGGGSLPWAKLAGAAPV